jgi:TolB-like protein
MGVVYRAHDARLERDVAIKVLSSSASDDDGARTRFRREALALGRLNHPNIGTVYDVGTHDGIDYLVMELVAGEPLSATLTRGPKSEREIAAIGAQVASALDEAHERGIIHRDLKPANIVVTPKGQAKVLDFGVARLARREADGEQTATMTADHLVGTFPYMAPEQLRGHPVDTRSDIWALGVVLYEMGAAARPFRGQTGFELSSAILNDPAPPLPSHVSASLRAVIERCLEKEPERRYQRAGEVRAALEAIRETGGTRWSAARYHLAKRRWIAAAVASLALIATAAAFDVAGIRTRLAGGRGSIERLAVLPLENLSGDAGQDYFADGMTEALITDFARLGNLKRVTARASVARYRGATVPLADIARDLKVDAIVTGSVVRSGDKVSISAQLVDPQSEEVLWTNRYDAALRDVISVQNQIVTAIVREIRLKLTPGDEARLASSRVVDVDAQDAYMRAGFHWQKLTAEDFKTAMAYCEKALTLDPAWAHAHLCVSRVAGAGAHMGFASPKEVASRVKDEARQALELDPTLGEAHAHLGSWTFLLDWDWDAAANHFRQAGEIPPANRVTLADLHMVKGERDDAARELQRSLEDDPLNSWTQTAVGGRLLRLGRVDEGIALLEKALSLDPGMGLAHRYLWTAFHLQGRRAQALTHAKTFMTTLGHGDIAAIMQRSFDSGSYQRAMLVAADALASRSQSVYVQPSEVARLYAYADEKDRAFEWLDRAYQARDTWMAFVNSDPRFASLQGDPRFRVLLERMRMTGRGT